MIVLLGLSNMLKYLSWASNHFLLTRDLGTAMAVCTLWNYIGGRPFMWKNYRGAGKVRKIGKDQNLTRYLD